MGDRQYDVYGVGAALVDTEIEVADGELSAFGIEKGLMTLVDEARQAELMDHLSDHLVMARRASGGSAANSLMAVAAFGGRAFYSCKVADDDNGRFYLRDLAEAGVVHPGEAGLPAGTTGKCLVLITPDAERTMNTYLGISETLCPKNVDHQAIANAEYIYTEGYLVTSPSSRQAAIDGRVHAEQSGTKTAFSLSDPGMVAHFGDGLAEMIGARTDLLFCNRDEALAWTGQENIEAACEAMTDTANTFAITLGGEGAVVYDGQRLHHIAANPVRPVDTNGAGDMFAGAFLYAITQGMDYARAGQLACRAAAQVVTQFGPRLPLAHHREILDGFVDA